MTQAKHYQVGEVARLSGVTVRTLRHYDDIGLVRPGGHSASGYRWYDEAALERLHQVLLYRELGFSLEDISDILAGGGDELEHLQRQHRLLQQRIEHLERVSAHLTRRMEAHMNGINLTAEEILEVFGQDDPTQHAEETRQRWGETGPYRESTRRTSQYTKSDWLTIKAEAESITQAVKACMLQGLAADSRAATEHAETHRQHLTRWYYDCSLSHHCGLADMYVSDSRFQKTFDDVAPGLAQYLHDAIYANAALRQQLDA